METMEVTSREKEEILQKRERLQKRGDYWLTPEGRAEIRATWDDPEDGAIPLPLLNELVKVEEESRQLKEAGIILLSIGKFTIDGQDHISRCCVCGKLPEQKHDQGCQFARARTIIESSPICVATEQALAGPEEFENQPGHTGGLLAEEKSPP